MRSYKPLNITVGTSSVMILPPLTPVEADIGEYAADTAYSYGDVIRTDDGLLYWAAQAGTTDAAGTEPDHDDGDETDGTVIWRRIRPERNVLTITNSSAVEICLARGEAAVADKGILLAEGSAFNEGYTGGEPWQGAWYAIAASGSGNVLCIQEG